MTVQNEMQWAFHLEHQEKFYVFIKLDGKFKIKHFNKNQCPTVKIPLAAKHNIKISKKAIIAIQ